MLFLKWRHGYCLVVGFYGILKLVVFFEICDEVAEIGISQEIPSGSILEI